MKTLNEGLNPKVNLIGHSRGGITNLIYALEYPQRVHSMISIGTPFFGSDAAESFGELIFPNAAGGIEDICDPEVYNGYYDDWNDGYESKYKNINSIAIAGTTTISYQREVLQEAVGQFSGPLAMLLQVYENAFLQPFMVLYLSGQYQTLKEEHPELGILSEQQFVDLVMLINSEVHYGIWYSDAFVPVDSQQGFNGNKNYNFSKYVKHFGDGEASLTPKRAVNSLPIIHNIETYDADIHSYILNNIVMKAGDTIDNEISNVGRTYGWDDLGGLYAQGWLIKIRNTHSSAREYAYNAKMCFFGDAQNWTGFTDIVTFWLEPGHTKIVEIRDNGTATSIAVSSISGSTRYIRYADELWNNNNVYEMTSYSSSKTYNSYSQHGIKVSIVGKNTNKWLINLTNNTGSGRYFDYNQSMCFFGDAQNWTGLSNTTSVYIANGASIKIEIQENGTADSIAISYTIGIPRYIFYAKNLNAACTLTSYGNIKPTFYTQNGIKAGIVAKNGNKWKIELTNNTGVGKYFDYNQKMCNEGDAQNWTGLSDVPSQPFYLANGASTQIDIQENGTATSIAISYMDGVYRKIFYAKNLNASSGTMTAMASTIDTSIPPDNCVAEGTLITLADGSQKAVEELTGDEMLLVWNLYTGTFDAAPIMFIDSDSEHTYEIINLSFSDGTEVEVIYEHAFWNVDLNRYVFLRDDAAQYIGHYFNKQTTDAYGGLTWESVQLTDVEIYDKYTTSWSPVTAGHLCYYVNGMLSMPGATDGLINYFEVDSQTMQYDIAQLQADIALYGEFSYEDFEDILPEEIFDAVGVRYLTVSLGKNFITWEQIEVLIARYSEFFAQ